MRVLEKAGNPETQGPGSLLSSQNLLEPVSGGAAVQALLPPLPSLRTRQALRPSSQPAPGPARDPHSPLFLTPKRLFPSCLTPKPLCPPFSPTPAPPGSFANSHTPPRLSSPPLWTYPSCLHCSLRDGGREEG